MTKVTLLGDSIRLIGYGKRTAELLGEEITVWQPEENCRFAQYTMRMLRDYAAQIEGSDIIHWNNGLWDTAILYAEDGCFTPLDEYLRNLERILRKLRTTGAQIIFATTTPTHPDKANWTGDMPPKHDNADIRRYNEAAVELMRREGIPVNDLYAQVCDDIEHYVCEDWIHPSPDGIETLAQAVAQKIREVQA